MKPQNYFSVSLIAKALSTYKVDVRRRAAREGWLKRGSGNQIQFVPPRNLQARCARLAAKTKATGLRMFSLDDRARAELARASHRLAAISELDRLARGGTPFEASLVRVSREFTLRCSPSSLRRWALRFSCKGFAGLMENKVGVVGPKPGKQKGARKP